jgi:hypothetical protein
MRSYTIGTLFMLIVLFGAACQPVQPSADATMEATVRAPTSEPHAGTTSIAQPTATFVPTTTTTLQRTATAQPAATT